MTGALRTDGGYGLTAGRGRAPSLSDFLAWSVDDLLAELLRSEAARRDREQAVRVEPSLDPDLLSALVRVMDRKGFGTVRELGYAAARAWAARIGVPVDLEPGVPRPCAGRAAGRAQRAGLPR